MGRTSSLLALLSLGCAPPPLPEAPDTRTLTCEPLELEPGEVRAKAIGCTDEVPRNGEGRTGDVLLQNALVSVVIRSPGESLTLVGAPGGTIVDAAPQGWNDRLFEAVPVVDGAWIAARDWSWGVDSDGAWLHIEGAREPTLGLNDPAIVDREDEGRPSSLTYRLRPDSQILELVGAEGLYLHGTLGTEPVRAGLYHSGIAYLTDATSAEDLGGAVRFDGAQRLIIGELGEVLDLAYPNGTRASGSCAGDRVKVIDAQGQALAWLEADFDSLMPYDAVALVCVAEGHDDGDPVGLSEDLALTPGPSGWLSVRVTADGQGVPAVVEVDGEAFALPAGGGLVPTGPGSKALRVRRGPAFEVWTGAVRVTEGALATLEVSLTPVIDTTGWVQVDLFRDAAPSRSARALASDDLDLAAAGGAGFALETAQDEVARPFHSDWSGDWIRHRGGSRSETVRAGTVWSWPWSSNTRYAGHGAVDWIELGPEEVLLGALGDSEAKRYTIVDIDWVDASGPPGGWDPTPDLVRLNGVEDFDRVFEILDRGVRLSFVGPVTWSPVPGGEPLASGVAVERGLLTGGSVASSGPLLQLVALEEPEDTASDTAPDTGAAQLGPRDLRLRLEARPDARVDRVDLYVDGAVLRSFTPTQGANLSVEAELTGVSGGYAIAVAYGEDWAVSAPVWLRVE